MARQTQLYTLKHKNDGKSDKIQYFIMQVKKFITSKLFKNNIYMACKQTNKNNCDIMYFLLMQIQLY